MKFFRSALCALILAASLFGVAHAELALREDTASQTRLIGPFVDSAGAPLTSLTIDAADVRLSANGGNMFGKTSGGCTHDELGMYACTFDATDTATAGALQLTVAETGALLVYHEYQVYPTAPFDRDFATAAPGYVANAPVNTVQLNAQTVSASGTVTFPNATLASTTNISAGTITNATNVATLSSGAISEASFATTTGNFNHLGIARQGTAQSATGTTVVLDASSPFADDAPIGMTLVACGSTQGYCQSQAVTDYVNSTDTATVLGWPVTPSGTITYYLFATAPGSAGGGATAAEVWAYGGGRTVSAATNITSTGGTIPITSSRVDVSVGAYQSGLAPLQPTVAGRPLDVSATGGAGVDWSNVEAPTTTLALTGTTISTSQVAASVTGAVGSVTGAVGSVTGAVGSVTGNVSGTVNGLTSTAQGNVRTAVGLATANLDTQLSTIDTVVDAVKVKTDQLNFSVTGQVDSNSESLNAQPVCGTGDAGTPWTGCP